MVTARDVRELLDDRPDLEPAVEAILEPDEPWTFEDVDVDSGAFGELVSRGVVEKTDGGDYRVADRAAVEQALSTENTETRNHSASPDWRAFSQRFTRLQPARLTLGAVGGVLAFLALLRLTSFPSVFQNGHVVLSGNDPYFYRYWVERLLADPEMTLATLPGGVAKGEPLLVATLWLLSFLGGGTTEAAGAVMAWYPVVSAVLTGLFVYLLATAVTDDRRVALAAVLMLAVTPGHALRTSLGFADHHAFDYVWLALTALGVSLVAAETDRDTPPSLRTLGASAAIAVGVAGQTLAWDASPLLLAPLGIYLAADVLVARSQERAPLSTGGPILAGSAVGALLAWAAHTTLGWHTTLVAAAPILLTVAGVGVVTAGVLAHRFDVPVVAFAGVELIGAVAGAVLFKTLRPDFWARLTSSLSQRLLADRAIAEVQGLFGESVGWLLLFGLLLFLAVPYLLWGTRRAVADARWLPVVVYAWYFLVLSIIQIRFVGQLALFTALFAGLGFVHVAEWVDVARRPAPFSDAGSPSLVMPDGQTLRALVLLFLLVSSLGLLQIPVKTSQVTIPAEQYETAAWMADYSADQNWGYPQNYVFSSWGRNRVYNYFVSGQSRSYGYARANFDDFATATTPEKWYERLRDRTGFIVTTPDAATEPHRLGTRLHQKYGSWTPNAPGVGHYRAVYAADGGSFKVFTLVEGAVITGTAAPNTTVTVQTSVDIAGDEFDFVRKAQTNARGKYSVRVPYPGRYAVGNQTVTVSDSAVRNGTTVTATS